MPRVLGSLNDITEEDKEQVMGTVPAMRAAFDAEFPETKWHLAGALFVSGERYALELSMSGHAEPTSSVRRLRQLARRMTARPDYSFQPAARGGR